MFVGECEHPRPGGKRCRSRRCSSCGLLWAGDQRRRLLANVTAYGASVALVTVTAPGADVLPWDATGERIEAEARYRWNRTAPARWRDLHRAAAQRARRRHGRFALVALTWEYQRRGALHRHVVIGVGTARERAAAQTYVDALHELRQAHGFGWVDRGRAHGGKRSLEVVPAERAARYVAKYLSPLDAAGKPTISSTAREPDVPGHVAHVSREMTGRTGITMRYLRHVRRCWVLQVDPATGETLQSIAARTSAATGVDDLMSALARLAPT